MRLNNARLSRRLCASFLILSCLGACSSPPELHVSADTYCEKARYIAATDAQLKVIAAPPTWDTMKPYAQQVAENNTTYNANCLEYTKGDDNAPKNSAGAGGNARPWYHSMVFWSPGKG